MVFEDEVPTRKKMVIIYVAIILFKSIQLKRIVPRAMWQGKGGGELLMVSKLTDLHIDITVNDF